MCPTFTKGPRGLAPARATDAGYPRASFGPCGLMNTEVWESGLSDFSDFWLLVVFHVNWRGAVLPHHKPKVPRTSGERLLKHP